MRLIILVAVLALLASAAAAQQAPAAPKGTVSFFMTSSVLPSCPAGWKAATYASGRLVVAVTNGAVVAKTVGEPLKDKEDRVHTHTYTTTVNIPEKSISGGSSCCNDQGAKKGDYTVSGTSASGTSKLPFVQLVVCEKL